jgi:hypothetical protein
LLAPTASPRAATVTDLIIRSLHHAKDQESDKAEQQNAQDAKVDHIKIHTGQSFRVTIGG